MIYCLKVCSLICHEVSELIDEKREEYSMCLDLVGLEPGSHHVWYANMSYSDFCLASRILVIVAACYSCCAKNNKQLAAELNLGIQT